MLTAADSALVSGASPDSAMSKTTRVKVLRPFLIKTERQEVGKVLEVSRGLAVELASANKVELLQPEAVAAAAVKDLKTDPPPAKGAGAKGA